MGLDSYISSWEILSEEEEIYNKLVGEDNEFTEVLYWRKFWELVDWFSNQLGFEIENCNDYEIDENDFKDLLCLFENKGLPYKIFKDYDFEQDIKIIKHILETTDFTKTKFKFHNWW